MKVDREMGFADGTGPTLRKLESYPPVLDLVFGAFGETSDGVKTLLDNLCSSIETSKPGPEEWQPRGKQGVGIGDQLPPPPTLLCCHACQCEMPSGTAAAGWRRARAGGKEEAVGKERGGEGKDGQRGAVAGESHWKELIQEG